MNIIARVDPHAAHQDVYDAHPDWIAVEARWPAATPLGDADILGHLCAWPL